MLQDDMSLQESIPEKSDNKFQISQLELQIDETERNISQVKILNLKFLKEYRELEAEFDDVQKENQKLNDMIVLKTEYAMMDHSQNEPELVGKHTFFLIILNQLLN